MIEKNLKIRLIKLILINKLILSKIYKSIIYILFFSLPLIHSRFFSMFGIDLDIIVSGNFEFTKVSFFHIISACIILFFTIDRIIHKKDIKLPRVLYLILFIIWISTLFSLSPITSLFWGNSKWHGAFLFINLIWLFIVLSNQSKIFLHRCIKTIIYSTFFVSIMGIWQLFFPSFDYWTLGNRALSTLGHPNYLSLYLLMIVPFLYKEIQAKKYLLYMPILIACIVCFLLTKSIWWIFLFLLFNIYYFHKNWKQTTLILGLWIGAIIGSMFFWYIGPEKFHSFLSRFALWETTLSIVASNWKTLLFWSGFETLFMTFDTAKSPYLYIYENFWFTADRPHNLFLNILYHTGLLWLSTFGYLIYKWMKKIKKTPAKESFILFLWFTIFNYPSIVHYSILALIIAIATHTKSTAYTIASKVCGFISFIAICLVSITGWYFSYQFYQAEILSEKWDIEDSIQVFSYHPNYFYQLWEYETWVKIETYRSSAYYESKINSLDDIEWDCEQFTTHFPVAENFFACWAWLEKFDKDEEALNYYQKWLEQLPDLWNKDSEYYDDFFIKNTINGNRFFSEKYSPIKKVLEKVWE